MKMNMCFNQEWVKGSSLALGDIIWPLPYLHCLCSKITFSQKYQW